MKRALLLLLLCLFAASAYSQQNSDQDKKEPKKERKLLQSLNLDELTLKVNAPQPAVQEEVNVEAPDYPGLDVSFETPANSLTSYKPYTKQELQAYSDLVHDFSLQNYDRSETARPHKPGRLFSSTISQ
jgi:hypothetical protein